MTIEALWAWHTEESFPWEEIMNVECLLLCTQIYLLLLFLRVLLSWFPAFNWERQPWLGLRQVTIIPSALPAS